MDMKVVFFFLYQAAKTVTLTLLTILYKKL